jgi:Spy/CpxP family protein refolding chaperone
VENLITALALPRVAQVLTMAPDRQMRIVTAPATVSAIREAPVTKGAFFEVTAKEKSMTKLNTPAVLTAVAIAMVAASSFAQTPPKTDAPPPPPCSCETGSGMMGGEGHGAGMMGGGPGRMGGGPGMMPGGPGMMGGGPGMIPGGPGMMGMHMLAALDLTDQQRAKIARILEDARKKNWDAMGKVMDESATLRDLYSAPTHDAAAIGRQTVKIAELRRPIIETMVVAHDQIEALLTSEQKASLRGFHRSWMMPGE